MRKILLTKGTVAVVYDRDYEWLSHWSWYLVGGRGKFYPARSARKGEPGWVSRKKRAVIFMHREIMEKRMGLPIPEGMEGDHINGDPLDNRRSNLRVATHQQNCSNRKNHRRSRWRDRPTSEYIGVSWGDRAKKWIVGLRANGKRKYVGCFDDEKEAARAYDVAAKKLKGEFTQLNFG